MWLPLVLYQGGGWDGEPLKIFYCLERNSLSVPNLPRIQLETKAVENNRKLIVICALILLFYVLFLTSVSQAIRILRS